MTGCFKTANQTQCGNTLLSMAEDLAKDRVQPVSRYRNNRTFC